MVYLRSLYLPWSTSTSDSDFPYFPERLQQPLEEGHELFFFFPTQRFVFHVGGERMAVIAKSKECKCFWSIEAIVSWENLASLPLCDCWTTLQHDESRAEPLDLFIPRENKHRLLMLLDKISGFLFYFLVFEMFQEALLKYVDMTRGEYVLPCYLQKNTIPKPQSKPGECRFVGL